MVITVTEPQVWVLIGVFSAAMFGMIGIVTTSFNRPLTSAIGGLQDTMNARFEAVDVKFAAVDAKFETLTVKLEVMDRDIQALTRHIFGGESR
ncbi:hypothetical protein [Parafrigoribacterium mesophilum]